MLLLKLLVFLESCIISFTIFDALVTSEFGNHLRKNLLLDGSVEDLARVLGTRVSLPISSCCTSALLIWFHCWEKHDIFDTDFIGQEHSDSVDTCTPSTSWWQTILKGLNVVLIDKLCLIISILLSIGLLHKSIKLHLWIVELGVCINDLVIIAEKLKSFRESFLRSMPLCKRRHE